MVFRHSVIPSPRGGHVGRPPEGGDPRPGDPFSGGLWEGAHGQVQPDGCEPNPLLSYESMWTHERENGAVGALGFSRF